MAEPTGPPRCASEALMAERDRHVGKRPGADEGFLQRWSRRKAEARGADKSPTEDPGAAAEGRPAPLAESSAPAQGEPAPVAPEDLPDIETLDASSDFSVFMRPGVPEHLRTQALRKLWRSDPIFSKLDGLLEYGEDYSIQAWPKGAIRTAYQIGRGFANELEQLGGTEPPSEQAQLASTPAGDAGAAIPSVPENQPLNPGADTPESGSGSTQAEIEPASNPPANVSTEPQRRPLPRRG
jgi:Protein of unknown function (DUF3306)